jgi:hypothetical protein
MLHVSTFRPDPTTMGPFLACLWQGSVPASFVLDRWIYLDGTPRTILLVWEGEADAEAWVQSAFGRFGDLQTSGASDATGGLQACLDRDLEGFGQWMRTRGSNTAEIEHGLDVRRRGLHASTQDAARAAGVAWMATTAPGD